MISSLAAAEHLMQTLVNYIPHFKNIVQITCTFETFWCEILSIQLPGCEAVPLLVKVHKYTVFTQKDPMPCKQ